MPDRPPVDRPMPSSFDDEVDFYNENAFQKITRKLKQEPFIPLGCVLTVAAFTGAYRAMRRGDHEKVNRMFRYRVLAQGFTVLAMVGGGIYYGAERKKEREAWTQMREADAEEKNKKWIRELEVRDEEDRRIKETFEKRRQRAAAAGGKSPAPAGAPATSSAPEAADEKKSGWGEWLWRGGSKKEDAAPVAATPETKSDKAAK